MASAIQSASLIFVAVGVVHVAEHIHNILRAILIDHEAGIQHLVGGANNQLLLVVGSTDEVLDAGFVIDEDSPEDIMDVFGSSDADDSYED